jgi:hypothetical protein
MKRILVAVLALCAAALAPWSARAGTCEVDDAVVTQVFQWDDGSIFVVLDRAIGCGCPQNFRAGFHKNDNEKFYIAAALTALATGKKVYLRGDNVNSTCPVHSNTARLISLTVKNN